MCTIQRRCTRVLPDGSTVEEIQEIEHPDKKFKRNSIITAIVMLAVCGAGIGIAGYRDVRLE